jgi:hypothetical protein
VVAPREGRHQAAVQQISSEGKAPYARDDGSLEKKGAIMRIAALLAAVCAVFATTVSPAGAVPPLHESFSFVNSFTDNETCGFPIAVNTVFTNDITEFSQAGELIGLQLHQSEVGTWSAKGVTLKVNTRETILVAFENGIPVIARHVGLLNSIIGPNGPLFLRTGQRAFEVVFDPSSGFYVDGPLIASHGVRANFDAAAVCAAFG